VYRWRGVARQLAREGIRIGPLRAAPVQLRQQAMSRVVLSRLERKAARRILDLGEVVGSVDGYCRRPLARTVLDPGELVAPVVPEKGRLASRIDDAVDAIRVEPVIAHAVPERIVHVQQTTLIVELRVHTVHCGADVGD